MRNATGAARSPTGDASEHINRWILLLLCVPLGVLGCSGGNSPEGVADQFMRAYYIEIDQAQALAYTAALAREKLQQEQQLVGQARRGGGVAQARPQIRYTHVRTQPEGRHVFLVYDLTIRPTQVPPMLKQVLITTTRMEEQWKVINFTEVDVLR
jgi:hypothetical protein